MKIHRVCYLNLTTECSGTLKSNIKSDTPLNIFKGIFITGKSSNSL